MSLTNGVSNGFIEAKGLNTFKYFDVFFTKTINDEGISSCPFCGKYEHFFVNRTNCLWNCKRCGKQGNFYDFIRDIYTSLLKDTKMEHLVNLAQYRHLPVSIFQYWKVAYNGVEYFFPVYNIENKLVDLRHYEIGKKIISLEGASVGLFGAEQIIKRNKEPIYICEGEFDTLAMDWLLKINKEPGVCVGLPGANTFKKDWFPYFIGKQVYICLDNDGAGNSGTEKIIENIGKFVSSYKFINWPNEYPSGYDINDYISAYGVKPQKPTECKTSLSKLFVSSKAEKLPEIAAVNVTQEKFTLTELMQAYHEVLDINKNLESAIKISLATALSPKIPGPNPLWLFLVGPPGYGKTEIIVSLKQAQCCYFQSSLSKRMLVSGFSQNGVDPSLIPKLAGKCLALKDYTEILAKSNIDRAEIFSILRGAFDGEVERDFANNVYRRYKTDFAFIAGVTKEIQNHSEASVGDRFLRFYIDTTKVDTDKQQDVALENALFGNVKREKLQQSVKIFLNQPRDYSIENFKRLLPQWFKDKIKPLAVLIAALRTPVVRYLNGAKFNTPVYDPESESGNRLVTQFQRLGLGLALLEDKPITEDIFEIVKTVAFDTVKCYNTTIFFSLFTEKKPMTKAAISEIVGLNSNSITHYLEDLIMLGLVELGPITRPMINNKPTQTYGLSSIAKNLWSRL